MSEEFEVENAMDQLIAGGIGQNELEETPEQAAAPEQDEMGAIQDDLEEPIGEPEGHSEDPARQRDRRAERMQQLANRTAEAEAKAKMLEEQAAFFRQQLEQSQRQFQQPQQPQVDEYLDPDEKWRRDMEVRSNQMYAQMADMNDRTIYASKAAASPVHAKYADRVEAELSKLRAQGQNATREGILAYLIGQDAIAAQGKPTKSSQRAAAAAAAARGATPGIRSNVQQTERAPSTAAERLKGVQL